MSRWLIPVISDHPSSLGIELLQDSFRSFRINHPNEYTGPDLENKDSCPIKFGDQIKDQIQVELELLQTWHRMLSKAVSENGNYMNIGVGFVAGCKACFYQLLLKSCLGFEPDFVTIESELEDQSEFGLNDAIKNYPKFFTNQAQLSPSNPTGLIYIIRVTGEEEEQRLNSEKKFQDFLKAIPLAYVVERDDSLPPTTTYITKVPTSPRPTTYKSIQTFPNPTIPTPTIPIQTTPTQTTPNKDYDYNDYYQKEVTSKYN